MLEIYPNLSASFSKCPACGCQLSSPESLFFSGKHILADVNCTCCEIEYYHSYPTENKNDLRSISFSRNGKNLTYKSKKNKWNAVVLSQSLLKEKYTACEYEIIVNKNSETIILFFCLYNDQKTVKAALDTIKEFLQVNKIDTAIVIPAEFKVLITFETAEIWTVRNLRNDFYFPLKGLDEFVKSQFTRFRKVFLALQGQDDSAVPVRIKWLFQLKKILS